MSTYIKGSKPDQHSKALLSSLCQVSACGWGCRGGTLATSNVPPSRLPLRACGCAAIPAGLCPMLGGIRLLCLTFPAGWWLSLLVFGK